MSSTASLGSAADAVKRPLLEIHDLTKVHRTASHERVAYDFYHAMGVGSSRIAHVRVHVNGQYWGLYQRLSIGRSTVS